MATQVTRANLESQVDLLNRMFPTADFSLDRAYGRHRLVRKGGSVDVSPRLPSGQLDEWMRAFRAGAFFHRRWSNP